MPIKKIYDSVVSGEAELVLEGIEEALDKGHTPQEIINKALISAMDEVGEKMKSGELFVPEVLVAAESMKEGLDKVKPLLQEGDYQSVGKVVIGTVAGDLHDIGKNLVSMLLESAGFDVIDLGTDVPKEKFVAAVQEHEPDIVGFSALLTTTMPAMEEAVKEVAPLGVKTIIGGAPVDEDFARKIGAHGYGSDAAAAVQVAKELVAA